VCNSEHLCSEVNKVISYTSNSAVKVNYTLYFETSHPVSMYRLKCLTNTIMMSSGQCEVYQSQIFSTKPQN